MRTITKVGTGFYLPVAMNGTEWNRTKNTEQFMKFRFSSEKTFICFTRVFYIMKNLVTGKRIEYAPDELSFFFSFYEAENYALSNKLIDWSIKEVFVQLDSDNKIIK